MTRAVRIAVLEDDEALAQVMAFWLKSAGHGCEVFLTGAAFMKALARESFDLLLIDWMLPDTSGDKVIEWVREKIDWPVPIMMATSRDSEEDIIHALGKGADDYVIKPLRRGELLARVAALIRRSSPGAAAQPVLELPPFSIDRKSRTISRDGTPVELKQKEFELAAFLFANADRVLSRGHILEAVWGLGPEMDTRTVDTHVSRLRKKLALGSETGWELVAVHGYGYRLERSGSPADED